MSLKTLPLLFINLGGEMMYILDQRLRAQNIPEEKAKKVLHDITGTMFNRRFMEELFKPQELYSKKAMRSVFDRLAHASIMRLNNASMDKLYDLMTMAFKYQISLCLRPKDVLLVTLNHMDAMRNFVEDNLNIKQQVENAFHLLIQHFAALSDGEFILIRQTLLNFFQDMHIRVSIFLKDKVQNPNGRFVLPQGGSLPWGFDPPGTIKVFDEKGGLTKTVEFPAATNQTVAPKEGSFALVGNRVTKLGTNMYAVVRPSETTVSGGTTTMTSAEAETSKANPQAKAQLNLLCKLIGGDSGAGKKEFRLNLFHTDEEEEQAAAVAMAEAGSQVINIDASKKSKNAELSRIMGELDVGGSGNQDEDDLLDLMDSAQ